MKINRNGLIMNAFGKHRGSGRSPFHREPANYKVNLEDGEILLYDEIGFWGITAEQFVRDLSNIKSDEVTVRINSPGGEVFDGTAIYNAIKNDSRKIITQIDGLAASMASGIAMAGDEVRMAESAFMMIHNPWSIAFGDADDMRKEADLLDKIGVTLANAYAMKSGMKVDDVVGAMADETWYTGPEALKAGMVDDVFNADGGDEPEALFDLSVFDQVPAGMKRKIESNLRDAGFSNMEAKRAVSQGFQTLHRDDANQAHRDDESLTRAVTALDRLIDKVETSIK